MGTINAEDGDPVRQRFCLITKVNHMTQIVAAQHFRQSRPLTDAELERIAPSIFTAGAHESRSERYTHIPTSEILTGLRQEGFEPFMASQTRSRCSSKREHAKHLIRLRHRNSVETREANEIILINSHDGSSSYRMMSGMFRFACSNGLIVGNVHNEIRIPHKGDVAGNVIEGAYEILDRMEEIESERADMEALSLSAEEQHVFASAALALRWNPDEHTPVTTDSILRARRSSDDKDNVWSTFNRLQENLVKGGIRSRDARGNFSRTRPMKAIDTTVGLNRSLWMLAQGMAALKS